LEILQNIYEENPNDKYDDQKLLTEYCKKHEDIFHLDTESSFFGVLTKLIAEVDGMVHIENKDVYVNTQRPFFIHAPGAGYLDNIIIRLGYEYDSDNKIKHQIFKNMITDKLVKSLGFKYLIGFIVLVVIAGIAYKYRSTILTIEKFIKNPIEQPKPK
jgi:hypothetical protein